MSQSLFPIRLRQARKRKKLTQRQVAEKLGVSAPTVTRWERGHVEPDTEAIKKLSEILDVSVDYLMGVSDIPEKPNENKDIDLEYVLKARKPLFRGVPISEEQAEFFLKILEAYYEKKLKEKGIDGDPS